MYYAGGGYVEGGVAGVFVISLFLFSLFRIKKFDISFKLRVIEIICDPFLLQYASP
jgi:hypothetical protein